MYCFILILENSLTLTYDAYGSVSLGAALSASQAFVLAPLFSRSSNTERVWKQWHFQGSKHRKLSESSRTHSSFTSDDFPALQVVYTTANGMFVQ